MMGAAKRTDTFFRKAPAPAAAAARGQAGGADAAAGDSGGAAAAAARGGGAQVCSYALYSREEFEAVNKCKVHRVSLLVWLRWAACSCDFCAWPS
jgi:hypothetical protein